MQSARFMCELVRLWYSCGRGVVQIGKCVVQAC